MKKLKTTAVFTIAFFGLFAAFELGPLRQHGAVILIDGDYSAALTKQYYLNGSISSFLACVTALALKVSFRSTFFAILAAGLFYATLSQLSDLNSIQYLLGAVLEFMLLFLGVSIFMLLVFYGISKLWPRAT